MGPIRANALLAVLSLAVAGVLMTGVSARSDKIGDASADLKLSTDRGETGGFDARRGVARSGAGRDASDGGTGQGDGGFVSDAFRDMICSVQHRERLTKMKRYTVSRQ